MTRKHATLCSTALCRSLQHDLQDSLHMTCKHVTLCSTAPSCHAVMHLCHSSCSTNPILHVHVAHVLSPKTKGCSTQ